MLRYVFLLLLLANVVAFGYYSYFYQPKPTESFIQAKTQIVNPVTFTNVSDELPPLIGVKK